MTSKKREEMTVEAYELLERLLVGHYGRPYEESHRMLARKLEDKFRSKYTNFKYRNMFFDRIEDLIEEVVYRLARINSKSVEESGEMIRDPELMSYRIAELVFREERRKMDSRLTDQPIEDNKKGAFTLTQPADADAESVLNEIVQECYDACVDKLPDDAGKVFRGYYPDVKLDPQELTARRKRLARELAGVSQTQHLTPEEEDKIMSKLQVKVYRLKTNKVEGCVTSCTEDKSSRDVRLSLLS
jgi:DNA-directed RNA polymerase specialized sigma24 family protein